MAEVTLTPTGVSSDSKYASVSSNYPASNLVGSSSSGTKYAGFNLTTGSGAETYIYITFDASEIPSNATITSMSAKVSVYGASNAQTRTATRQAQMYSGTTAKGSATSFTISSTQIITIADCGSWTRSELNDLRLRVYFTRSTSNTTTTQAIYLRGADVTIEYTENSSGGGDTQPSTDPATFTITENLGTYRGDTSYISDNDTSNIWQANDSTASGKYVQWEFSKNVILTGFNYYTSNTSEIYGSGTYLQVSTDGSTWKDLDQFNGNQTQNFSGYSEECKYVRIYTKSGSGYVSISEAMPVWTEISSGGDDTGDDDITNNGKLYSYTGAVQEITLDAGKYILECWGAQGGTYQSYQGGLGGYSIGTIELTQSTKLYLYVGGQPATTSTSRAQTPGGFNGGGTGQNRYYSSTYTYGQGGGGASDIRVGQDSLYARVIVAGGGGGSASSSSTTKWGGGETGGPGGASSTASYVAGQTAPTTSGYYLAGTFGNGANAYTSRTDYQCGSGGGGGGWYGGYAYNYAQDSQTTLREYCGGGSGYVYTSSTASNYPSGCLLNSAYYLIDAQTIGGNTSFPSTSGGSETGHSGNGAIRITKITTDTTNLRLKISGNWQVVTAIYHKENGEWKQIDTSILSNSVSYIKK